MLFFSLNFKIFIKLNVQNLHTLEKYPESNLCQKGILGHIFIVNHIFVQSAKINIVYV